MVKGETQTGKTAVPKESRIRAVDSLRGLAAVAVLIYHYSVFGIWTEDHVHGFHTGRYGVHLFFMISGFVILMTASRMANVTDFIWGRFSRLFPAYWCGIAIATVAAKWSGRMPHNDLSLTDTLLNMTMIQTALGRPHVDAVYWTLYIELLFYICVALAMCSGQIRNLPKWLAAAVLVDTVVALSEPWIHIPGWWRIPVVFPFWSYMYLFTYGVWLYRSQRKWTLPFLAVSGLCLLNALVHDTKPQDVILIGFLGWTLAHAASGKAAWLEKPWFLWLGTISYSLYLIHANVGFSIIRTLVAHGWSHLNAALLATMIALSLASLITYTIERPTHDALRRWWKSRIWRAAPKVDT